MSKDNIDKAIADAEAKIEAAGPVVVPVWVTDPVDREMIRRGRARVVPVVDTSAVAFVTDEWLSGEGSFERWEVRDNGRTDAERLLDEKTRREIADQIEAERKEKADKIEAERKATIGGNRRNKKKTLAYDALEPLAIGREKRGGVTLWKACHEVTKGRSESGKRLYDRIQEKRRLDKG